MPLTSVIILSCHPIIGDSDSSDVTETLLLEAQEQANKNKVEDNEDEDEEENADQEGFIHFFLQYNFYFIFTTISPFKCLISL